MARLSRFAIVLLLIEFLDELVYGAREAAWPLIRDDLGLSYAQIGLLLGLPGVIGSLIEPIIGILGDVWKRRTLVLGGGLVYAAAAVGVAAGSQFFALLVFFSLLSPASGSFVSLSQAALMDEAPDRHEKNLARWTFAGSLGVVAGPLALGAAVWMGLGWRGLFTAFGVLALALVALAWRFPFPLPAGNKQGHSDRLGFRQGARDALAALRRKEVLRWLVLLEFSDLMLDILLGFLALYFVDVVGVSPAQAGIAVAVWSGLGLLGDFLLIPLLERVKGLDYLRISVLIELLLYPAFLLVPGYAAKVALAGLLGFFNAGWYSVLKGRLYSSMPGQSGTVMTVNNITGAAASLIPVGLGLIGQRWGLQAVMWALLAGPIALGIGIPGKIRLGRR